MNKVGEKMKLKLDVVHKKDRTKYIETYIYVTGIEETGAGLIAIESEYYVNLKYIKPEELEQGLSEKIKSVIEATKYYAENITKNIEVIKKVAEQFNAELKFSEEQIRVDC